MTFTQIKRFMNAQTQIITVNGKNIIVVRDDLLVGGTKEAALLSFIATLPCRELVYAGPRYLVML